MCPSWRGTPASAIPLRAELPPDDYVTWIAPLRLLDVGDDVAVIQTPNIFVREVLEGRLAAPFAATCSRCFGPATRIELVIASPPTAGVTGWHRGRRP